MLKLLKIFVWLTLMGGVSLCILFPSYSQLRELKEINRSLDEKIEKVRQQIDNLRVDLEAVKRNPEYRELLLRKKLLLLKEGEYILKIESNQSSGVEQPGSSPGS